MDSALGLFLRSGEQPALHFGGAIFLKFHSMTSSCHESSFDDVIVLGAEDRCLHVALPVAAFLERLSESVNLRATAATRTGCVWHGVGHQTPFSGRGSRNAVEDLRPNILQLNTEGLTAEKISVIEQQGYRNKAFIIVLQETTLPHYHTTTLPHLPVFELHPT